MPGTLGFCTGGGAACYDAGKEETGLTISQHNHHDAKSSKDILDVLVDVAGFVMQTVAMMEVDWVEESKTDVDLANPPDTITALMKMSGDVEGVFALSVPNTLARKIGCAIAYCEPEELPDELLKEGVGEIVNQVTGVLRARLSIARTQTQIFLPEVIDEAGRMIEMGPAGEIFTIAVDCGGERLLLRSNLTFKPASELTT